MMLLGAATAPAATGAAPIWVAAIGALSLIAGALIPELFKLLVVEYTKYVVARIA